VFLLLVEGERCFFLGAWLVVSPVFSTGFPALIHTSLTDTVLELTCRSKDSIQQQNNSDLDLTSGCIFTVSRNQKQLNSTMDLPVELVGLLKHAGNFFNLL
jgi:hypothetical protein